MKISIGCDHGGFLLKEKIVSYLKEKGHIVFDEGCFTANSVHYPVYASSVCEDVLNKISEMGILICTSGFGMCICANKYKGLRAATIRSTEEAFLSRSHNDCNILCLGAKFTSLEDAKEIVDVFLETPFSEGERHKIRLGMIKELEDK